MPSVVLKRKLNQFSISCNANSSCSRYRIGTLSIKEEVTLRHGLRNDGRGEEDDEEERGKEEEKEES